MRMKEKMKTLRNCVQLSHETRRNAKTHYRSLPVNITTTRKKLISMTPQNGRQNPLPRQHDSPRKHSRDKVLGKTRPNPQPSHQLLPQRHPLPIGPSHPHHSLMLPALQPHPRHPPPQQRTPISLHASLTSLPPLPALPPLRTRKRRLFLAENIDLSLKDSQHKQLPHGRRSRLFGCWLRCSNSRYR